MIYDMLQHSAWRVSTTLSSSSGACHCLYGQSLF